MTPPEDDKGPDYKPTAQLEKVPAWAIALTEKVTHGFAAVETRLAEFESETNKRLTKIEAWKDDVNDGLKRHSGGLTRSSNVDAEHEKNFSTVFTKLDGQDKELATVKTEVRDVKTGIVTLQAAVAENTIFTKQAIAGFFKTPLGMALLGLAMAAAGYATNWLTAHGGH
jgi:hypothetical protein